MSASLHAAPRSDITAVSAPMKVPSGLRVRGQIWPLSRWVWISTKAGRIRPLEAIRSESDVVVDTSDLSLRELRERLLAQLGSAARPDQLAIQLISFGYKYGLPLEADLVFDIRFMQNPYYVPELRKSSGLTEPVREYVLGQPVAQRFLTLVKEFLDFAVPAYIAEGKSRLTIAIGCTGGFHRSIVLSEELAAWLRTRDMGPVAVFHRELERT